MILDWIFSNLSKWVLTFNNQLTSTSTYLISHQKMSIRLNSFLQCSYSNKSRHLQYNLLISFFHSFSYSSDCFPKHNLFFIEKPFQSNSNDLRIFRNAIWKKVLNVYIYIYIYIWTVYKGKTLANTANFPTSFGRGHSHGTCFLYDL